MKSLYIFAACMLMILSLQVASGQTISKEKRISGHFSADKGKLVIDNRYGKLTVHTWNRDEVTVDIIITAKARSSDDALELLDKITIAEPTDKDTRIYYKTEIDKSEIKDSEFMIDYVINMPRRHEAQLINKYGDIDLAETEGKLEIDLEYGKLKSTVIRGRDKLINVSFGSATIASIGAGSIVLSHSTLFIEDADSIDLTSRYGNTTIGTVRELNIDQEYGELEIGSVRQLKGIAKHSGLLVEKLLKNVEMTLSHCPVAQFDYVGPKVNTINMISDFSN